MRKRGSEDRNKEESEGMRKGERASTNWRSTRRRRKRVRASGSGFGSSRVFKL